MRKSRPVPLNLHDLSGRVDLFRLTGGAERDPAIDNWLRAEPVDLRSIAELWFNRIRRCGPDVRELMHDGCPTACIEDAAFAYVITFKSHVNVGFFYGAFLNDPAGLLEGSGKRMRHVKLSPTRGPDADFLGELINAAYLDIRARLVGER